MDFNGVFHKTSEQLAYAANENELIVNIKTGYDVKHVFIHHGDPFEAGILGGNEVWKGTRTEICAKKRLQHQLWWTITLTPEYKRCKYYFELQTDTETWYYFEDGFLTEEEKNMEGRLLQYFIVPWMNPADVNRTPDWVNETVWYQIFPDRFCNGTPEKNTPDILPWQCGPVTRMDVYGGNLEGIRQKLSYLKDLGINGIYLNPIMDAESNHKYDTRDYCKIDPMFGTEEDFTRLVKEAHEYGIRVMVDAVFNHSGRKFAPWLDVLEHGQASRYADWFMVNQWPVEKDHWNTRDGAFYSFAFAGYMPKLNTNNDEVIAYFCDILEDWIRRYDIDGIRFDVGNEVSHRFLKKVRERVKGLKPDIYLLGEIWHDASQWLLGDEYDSVMNYPFLSGIQDFFVEKSLKANDFEYMINRCYTMYMKQCNNVLFNLLDSHDTDRMIHRVGDLDIFYQQLAVLFTMPGSPCIYYGTEIVLEGAHDPDCRRCMPWEELDNEENSERIREMKRLIALRKEDAAFRSLSVEFPETYRQDRLVQYFKTAGEETIEVLLNCGNMDAAVEENGKVLFARGYEEGRLKKNGTLIRRK